MASASAVLEDKVPDAILAYLKADAELRPELHGLAELRETGCVAAIRGRFARAAETFLECIALAQKPGTCAADSFVLASLHNWAGSLLLRAAQQKSDGASASKLRSDSRGLELFAKSVTQLRKCIATVDARLAADTAFELSS